MSEALVRITGYVLVLGVICAPPCWAVDLMVNKHGFSLTEQVLPGRGRMAAGTLGSAFLLSNCPRKGCVTLSGTIGAPDSAPMVIEGSACRPTVAAAFTDETLGSDIILTIPTDPACAGVPQEASGRYFPICAWAAPEGDLSWTGWHSHYNCWESESGKPFQVGPH